MTPAFLRQSLCLCLTAACLSPALPLMAQEAPSSQPSTQVQADEDGATSTTQTTQPDTQNDRDQSAPDSDAMAGAAMDMSAIEAAYQAGNFVAARAGLKQLSETDGRAAVLYRYGRILTDPRSGDVDIPLAAEMLTRAAAMDYVPANTLLARIYLSGNGVPRDPERAARLLQGNATRGEMEAQYYLALLLRAGEGLPQNDADAFLWMRAAAEQGHIPAAYEASQFYAKGVGTEADPEKALHWLQRAAGDGHAEAQLRLASAYDAGQGVPQNRNAALDWYRRAAENGHPLAMRIIGMKYLQGEGVYEDGTAAVRWLTRAADAGEPGALFNMAMLTSTGNQVPQDDVLALQYLEAASATGLLRATHMLAAFVEKGRGTEADLPRAVRLYERAASDGYAPATEALARLASTGALEGMMAPHDMAAWVENAALAGDQNARQWLTTQAEAGLRTAQTRLARVILAQGEAPEEAIVLLTQAANAGDVQAQFLLGEAYSTGQGVTADYVAAHKWHNIAATQGHSKAAAARTMLTDLMTQEQLTNAQNAARQFLTAPPPPPAGTKP